MDARGTGRNDYTLFSPAEVCGLALPNRLVRSATWDPSILIARQVTDEVLDLYRALAAGGVGMIISGGFPVFEQAMSPDGEGEGQVRTYADLRVDGLARLVDVVRRAGTGCGFVAQIEGGHVAAGPSDIPSPYGVKTRPLAAEEIELIVDCFVEAIVDMKAVGFDGVQLHAAHGGLLSRFLSPYTNRRDDAYGGSVRNRVHIVRQIVSRARGAVGDYPILIKVNSTDYMEGGIDIETFPALAREIERAGVDGIEVSGGMWDCLARPEEVLGFRPVPAPESHTRINRPERQSYFLPYAERLDLSIPVVLVGGNRDVDRLEQIIRQGHVDLIALCRPLISEPDLPNRWLEGRGSSSTDCISCNSCIHDMFVHPGRETPGLVRCVFKGDRDQHKAAQAWLATWVEENVATLR
jgi:2,4-dienoyl-CoA reductase-like NADH-dependent reductase (Old Yellow Enzyme family)